MGGLVQSLGQTFLRAYVVDGIPSSGVNDPSKTDGIAAFTQIDAELSDMALVVAVGVAYDTLAHLNADLLHPAGTIGLVYNDGTASNNGVYVKTGSSGSGGWSATGIALASSIATTVALLEAAAPWYNTSFAQVSQVRAAIQAAGGTLAMMNALSGEPGDPAWQQWDSGGTCTQTGPLGAFIKSTLGYSDAQMTTLFAAARASSF